MSFLLALDQGTSSTRSIVFDREGHVVASAQRELRQIYPQPGWVEHDPLEIWASQLATAQEALQRAGITAYQVNAIGITNQRETTVIWNRRTGLPLHHAIVWQDRRTEPHCQRLRDLGEAANIQERTGLVVDAYFSGTKVGWILDHVPGARAAAECGDLAFGTVDTWLLWQLTGGRVHATDVSNASRTMLFNIRTGQWDPELLSLLQVPPALLPQVYPSSHVFGETDASLFGHAIPIAGIAGDQQSALFGQACFRKGLAKNTYGTGCFLLMHTADQVQTSVNGLITTRAAQRGAEPQYALEGSVFIGGAVVQWLRDGLRAIDSSTAVQALAQSVPDSGGVVFVPAFTGLGAPYWQPNARGAIVGLSHGTGLGHIARAALESIAFQSAALIRAMGRDAAAGQNAPLTELRVDGGACVNDLLMQFQADLLGVPVVRPKVVETTALGAAYLAGLGTGFYQTQEELEALWQPERSFLPTMSQQRASELMANWEHAVRQATLA
jgi:glycerol kinase